MEIMTLASTSNLVQAWQALQRLVPISAIRTESQYDSAVETLNGLIDLVGNDETHPLFDMLETLGVLIQTYEDRSERDPPVANSDILQLLMDEHDVSVDDFPEIGSPETVTAILSGQYPMKRSHIHVFAQRFGVAPETFLLPNT